MPTNKEVNSSFLDIALSDALTSLSLPNSRDLYWRSCSFKDLLKDQWRVFRDASKQVTFKPNDTNANYLVFINGQFDSTQSHFDEAIEVKKLANDNNYDLHANQYFRHLDQLVNPAVNQITIADNQKTIDIHCHFVFETDPLAFISNQLAFVFADNARVVLHMHYYNQTDHKVWYNQVMNMLLHKQANVSLFEYYQQSDSLHITKHNDISLLEEAQLNQFVVNKHFPFLYLQQNVDLNEKQAKWHVAGFYILKDKQVAQYRLLAKHLNKHTNSNQFMRGLLADKSSALFDSSVEVVKGSCGSESHQMNNNLLLSDYAKIQSFPILEIDEDDVVCSHGSTIGALDEAMLFYLQSRGLSEKQSFSLMKQAFISEVIQSFEQLDNSKTLKQYIYKEEEHD